ncbi:MAG: glycosyltransferase family 61 protein [Acidobacteria bacterium]|nr:glycosyltransferase family 61 protein [Acidobacteriota bacterium]
MKEINVAFIGKKTEGQDKIYISRAKARVRYVLNEAELASLLKNNGFEILFGEDLSLAEQIEVFGKCSTLMGIHGAGLTNCIFMKPGGNVVELRKREKNYGYWHLADSLGHKYYYYNGVPDSDASLIGHGCNLTISAADLESQILKSV